MTGVGSGRDFAAAFAEAVVRRGLTLEQIQAELRARGAGVSAATLSHWQTGRSLPTRARSLRAVAELERILALPPGQLAASLAGDPLRWDMERVSPAAALVGPALAEMGLGQQRFGIGLACHDVVRVGADGAEREQDWHLVFRSEVEGLVHLPVVHQQDAREHGAPEIEALTGCRVGQVRRFGSVNLVVAELVLPRPLARGELYAVGARVHWAPTATRSSRVERSLPNRHLVLSQQVVFEGEPPRRACHYYFHRNADSPDGPTDFERLPGRALGVDGQQLQRVQRDASLGIHGLGWQW